MESPTPVLIAAVVDDAERPALVAASEQLSECLSAASGVLWPVGIRLLDSIADIQRPTVIITSLLPEVARADEPISLTEARWRRDLSKLMELAVPSVFVCTVFRFVAKQSKPGQLDARPRKLERIRLLNLLAAQLSHDIGINVIDIDSIFAHAGARQMQTDYRLAGAVAAEVAAYTIVVGILAVGLDDIIPIDVQERAREYQGEFLRINDIINRRLKQRQLAQRWA